MIKIEQKLKLINIQNLKTTQDRFSLINLEEARIIDKINDSLMWGAREFLKNNGFIWLEVPCITKITGACENVNTLYALNHFGNEAYLAQTGQLYLEAKIPLHKKIWTIIPSSRAEDSADQRHLNQFQLIELEHHGNLNELLNNMEAVVKSMINKALEENKDLLTALNRTAELQDWINNPFKRVTYTEAIKLLKMLNHDIKWGEDLTAKEEELIVKELGNRPIFVTHYPKEIKFFNMKENESDPEIVNSADLVLPYSGESAGSAEREDNYEKLVQRLVESPMFKILSSRGKTLDDFKDYLTLVKKNPILHSGCGIGFTRVSQAVLGIDDIRVACNFPLQSNVLY